VQPKPDEGAEEEEDFWDDEAPPRMTKARPFCIGDLDLSLLEPRRLNGRPVATALAAACLGVYERDFRIAEDFFGDEDDEQEQPPARRTLRLPTRLGEGARLADPLERGLRVPRRAPAADFFGDAEAEPEVASEELEESSGRRFSRLIEADRSSAG
jgi:hypothetical protein